MKKTAIGIAEFTCISAGLSGLDIIVKNNDVHILKADMICPGKYLIICGGLHAAVEESISQIRARFADMLTNGRVIGNLSEGIIEAFNKSEGTICTDAIGVIETRDVVTAIYAADESVKTANVAIMGLRIANGVGGKGVVVIAGSIADVSIAIERTVNHCESAGTIIGKSLITNPDGIVLEKLAQCM